MLIFVRTNWYSILEITELKRTVLRIAFTFIFFCI